MCIATYCHMYRYMRFGANFGIQFGVSSITDKNILDRYTNSRKIHTMK